MMLCAWLANEAADSYPDHDASVSGLPDGYAAADDGCAGYGRGNVYRDARAFLRTASSTWMNFHAWEQISRWRAILPLSVALRNTQVRA